jgi:hypothetical protein
LTFCALWLKEHRSQRLIIACPDQRPTVNSDPPDLSSFNGWGGGGGGGVRESGFPSVGPPQRVSSISYRTPPPPPPTQFPLTTYPPPLRGNRLTTHPIPPTSLCHRTPLPCHTSHSSTRWPINSIHVTLIYPLANQCHPHDRYSSNSPPAP